MEWVRDLFPDRTVAVFRSRRAFADEDGVVDQEAYRVQKSTAMQADILLCTASSVIYDQRLGGGYNGVTERDVILFDEADQVPGLAALASDLNIDRATIRDLKATGTTPTEVADSLLSKRELDSEIRAKAKIVAEIARAPEVWYKRVGMTDDGGVAVIHRLPGRLLKKIANRPSTIFVSATLSVNNRFDDFIRSMGIESQSVLSDKIEPERHGEVYWSMAVDYPVDCPEWLKLVADEINGSDGPIEQPVVWNFSGAMITHPGIPI